MKTSLKLITSVAALAALISGANAQSTSAVTDPVGYITVNVNPSAAGSTKFSAIAPTLTNKVDFQGTATFNATGDQVTLTGTPLTAAAFNTITIAGAPAPAYYLEIGADGAANEGKWMSIATNTQSAVTLSAAIAGAGGTTVSVKIRKHVTLGEFLGANNTAGLLAGPDPVTADEVIFLDSVGNLTSYFFSTEVDLTGWRDSAYEDVSATPIKPGQGVFVAHKAASAPNFVFVGHVKTGKTELTINPGYNLVGVTHATGTDLNTSNLEAPLLHGPDAVQADEALVLGADGGFTSYFFSTEVDLTGWRNSAYDPFTGLLKEGTAFLLQHKLATTVKPIVSAQSIQN